MGISYCSEREGQALANGDWETYNGEGHGEGPKASPGMVLDSLPHVHAVLTVLAMDGIVHEICTDNDLGTMSLDRGDPVLQLIFWFDDRCRHFEFPSVRPYQ